MFVIIKLLISKGSVLWKRVRSRNGEHTIDVAEQLGVGSKVYELIEID